MNYLTTEPYLCEKYALLVFPNFATTKAAYDNMTLPLAETLGGPAPVTLAYALEGSAALVCLYWSAQLNCKLYYLKLGEQFLFLEQVEIGKATPVRILSESGIMGYIVPNRLIRLVRLDVTNDV